MIITTTLICFILTAVMFMQFKVVQETKDADISSMQEAELKQGLSTWKSKYQDAKEKNEELDKTIETYKQENYSKDKTKETLESELTKLEMAMGKKDVEGSGIIITIREKRHYDINSIIFIQKTFLMYRTRKFFISNLNHFYLGNFYNEMNKKGHFISIEEMLNFIPENIKNLMSYNINLSKQQ